MVKLLRWMPLMVLGAALILAFGACSLPGQEAKYPSKPVEYIESTAPGAGGDLIARFTAGFATKRFGVPVNVVNIEGASGMTGMLRGLKAAPDGYTLLQAVASRSSYLYAVRTDVPIGFDEQTFVARVTGDYYYIVANVDTGWKTLDDMLKYIKAQPADFRWGAGLYGSNPMFSQLKLFTGAGLDTDTIKKTRMVVFETGGAASQQATLKGDVQATAVQENAVDQMVSTGRVRALVSLSPQRSKWHPDIPTTTDLGYPKAQQFVWYGVGGPKGLPDSVVKVWDEAVKWASQDAGIQAEADKLNTHIMYLPPSEFKTFVLQQYEESLAVANALALRK